MQTIGGRYVIEEEIGVGGMGTVYRGQDTQTRTPVAVKMLKPEAIKQDNRLIERFQREGEALRTLNHPNMVKMLDVVEDNGNHYLIMEYVASGDLNQLLKREQLSISRVINIALDIADALTRAHRLDIVHRDLKPGNVLIADDGTPRLTDFGVAHIAQKERVTETNAIVGTIDYLPPEALDSGQMDTRSDIWAFGVMLYEMIAGERPFTGDTIAQIVMQIITQPHTPLDEIRTDTPDALVDLVHRMLEKDPNLRISSVRIIGAELEAMLTGGSLDTGAITPQTALPQPGRFAASTPAGTQIRHHLPIQTTQFIGRQAELNELDGLLRDPDMRLVTILAPGGMGKTRLSIEAAARQVNDYPDGVHFIELAPLTTVDAIPSAIGDKVGMQFSPAPIPPVVQLAQYLRDRTLLLVMDNFEHLLEGADIITTIMQLAPNVRFIVTSREKLNLSGEAIFNLGGMDFPRWETPEDALEYSAVKMFMQSARRVVPGFVLETKDLDYVGRICRLVQGLPLGILLAAAWLDTLSTQEIAEEIDESMDFLESELRDLPERQRSVRAVFEYSWNLMPEKDRDVFSKLAVFRGGFDRKVAQKVVGASLRNLTSLVNKSLVTRDPNSGRYNIHELVRQFGESQLEDRGELETMRYAHADYYSKALTHEQDGVFGFIKVMEAIIKPDFENVSMAWMFLSDHNDLDRLNPMIMPLYLYGRSYLAEYDCKRLFKYARSKVEVPIEEATHPAQRTLWTHYIESEPDMEERLTRAEVVAKRNNDLIELDYIYFTKAAMTLLKRAEPYETALEHLQHSIAFSEEHNIVYARAAALYFSMHVYACLGDYDKVLEWADKNEKFYVSTVNATGNNLYLYRLYVYLVRYYVTGDDNLFVQTLQELQEQMHRVQDKVRYALGYVHEGFRQLQVGNIDTAYRIGDEVLTMSYTADMMTSKANGYTLMALISLTQGNIAIAKDRLQKAHETNVVLAPSSFPEHYYGLALVHLMEGDFGQAQDAITMHITESLTCPVRYHQKFGDAVYYTMALLPILAGISHGRGESILAAQLLGADSQRPFTHRFWAEDLPVLQELADQVQSTLGDDAYDEAFTQGKSAKIASLFERAMQ